jgi:molybdenum cofactor biosynthesis enzyme MoaA
LILELGLYCRFISNKSTIQESVINDHESTIKNQRSLAMTKQTWSLDTVTTIEDLSPNPLVYERTAFMEHIRRYAREDLRAYYQRQRIKGADVYANYVVNLWEYEHGVDQLTSRPWNITIPLTEVCNAKCAFCCSPLVPAPQALAVHEVQHFADALRYALRVSLQGLGEPLAHPHFEEIAQELRKYLNPVARLEIITNGWLLSGRRWELLKSLQLRLLQVSVNASTDRTHQIAMGSAPGTFDRVVANVESVLADPWRVFLKLSMVITKHSLAEVPSFLDLFAAKGVKAFQFNPLLPLTSPDWGFGHTDQYVDLWCGHVPNAAELVERAASAIARHREHGARITAAPEEWLLPVEQWKQPELIQLSTDQQSTAAFQSASAAMPQIPELQALCIRVQGRRVVLTPHAQHTRITDIEPGSVGFKGSARSCRWAYLLVTAPDRLDAGHYTLDLQTQVKAGQLYGGILDVARNDFIAQVELRSGTTSLEFTLTERRLIQIIIRQGADDAPVVGLFEGGTIEASANAAAPSVTTEESVPSIEQPAAAPKAADVARAEPTAAAEGDRDTSEGSHTGKPGRIYCPMVYTTLSIFHHSLDVSTCCYMETPGTTPSNMKEMTLLEAYNDPGFKLVRRTLNSDRHVPVCDSCSYGALRSP